jgi:hypothetical protein
MQSRPDKYLSACELFIKSAHRAPTLRPLMCTQWS